MKQFAMLGMWHVHAPGYAREINQIPDCRISKVWDVDEKTALYWAQQLHCERANVEDILSDSSIEGVIVCNSTADHAPLIIAACNAGKAVFTEKVLTLTTGEANQVKQAVQTNRTRFAISFPHFSEPAVQFALHFALSGKLGQINYARVRKAHNGATGNWLPPHFYDARACGGGAMIDLGAHPMYLLCHLLGEPITVQSAFTEMTGHGVEDNAVSLLTFSSGAIGVSETSFVSNNYPFTIEIGGTEGSLRLLNDAVQYCNQDTEHQWVVADTLPDGLPSPLVQWACAPTESDIPSYLRIDPAVRLTRVMEMAYQR